MKHGSFGNLHRYLRGIVRKPRSLDEFLGHVQGVVHVGAHFGEERDVYAKHGLDVLWIEPIQEVYQQLVANIAALPQQKAICALLTDRDGGQYDFHISSNEGASSSVFDFAEHRDIWPEVHYVETRRLRSTRLETLFRDHTLSPETYQGLIMDVQGAELMVLKGAGDLLRQFCFVKSEAADFESYAGGASLEELDCHLRTFGFKEIGRSPFARREAGGTYWDVVWAGR